jgi:hypothetical protein
MTTMGWSAKRHQNEKQTKVDRTQQICLPIVENASGEDPEVNKKKVSAPR